MSQLNIQIFQKCAQAGRDWQGQWTQFLKIPCSCYQQQNERENYSSLKNLRMKNLRMIAKRLALLQEFTWKYRLKTLNLAWSPTIFTILENQLPAEHSPCRKPSFAKQASHGRYRDGIEVFKYCTPANILTIVDVRKYRSSGLWDLKVCGVLTFLGKRRLHRFDNGKEHCLLFARLCQIISVKLQVEDLIESVKYYFKKVPPVKSTFGAEN